MTTTEVIERLDERSRSAVATAVSPPLAAIVARAEGRRRSRRRRSLLAAAAVVVAIAVVGGVLATAASRRTTVTTTDDQDHGAAPHLVPSVWPAGLDAPTTTTGGHPWNPRPLPGWILAHDGRAAVRMAIDPFPLVTLDDSSGSSEWEQISIGGRPGWAHAEGPDERVELAVHAGWTLQVASRSANRATLERLAGAFDPTEDQLRADDLPAGWSTEDVPDGLATLLGDGGGLTGPNWDTVGRTSTDAMRSLSVSSAHTAHAAQVIEVLRQLYGHDASIDLGLGGVIVHDEIRSLALWAPSKDVVAVASGMASDDDEVLTALRSARQLDDQEWSALEADRRHVVDGSAIHDGERVVAQGSSSLGRWMVSTAPVEVAFPTVRQMPHTDGQPVVILRVRSDDGSQYESGSTASARSTGYSRQPRLIAYDFGAPPGLRGARVRLGTANIETVTVPMPDLNVTYVIGLVSARDTDVRGSTATLTATLPDGSPYTSVNASGG